MIAEELMGVNNGIGWGGGGVLGVLQDVQCLGFDGSFFGCFDVAVFTDDAAGGAGE